MSEYQAISPQEYYGFVGKGQDAKTGGQRFTQEIHNRPVEEVEKRLLQDTDTLIGTLDGSIMTSKHFLDGERVGTGPVDVAIFLDKSARPVRALTWELWDDMSAEARPEARFLNIDKVDYLYSMGYSAYDVKHKYIPTKDISTEKYDPAFLTLRAAEIRALFLKHDKDLILAEELIDQAAANPNAVSELEKIWQMESQFDEKYVAIVDEVQSSGATLKVATDLLRVAFPTATLEPVFWSTPQTMIYPFYDSNLDEVYDKLADTERPLWYDASTSGGRGGIEGKRPELSSQSNSIRQRIGKHVLGIPYNAINDLPDIKGSHFRKDFVTLSKKFRDKKVTYIPSLDRADDDIEERISKYYRISFMEWAKRRRQQNRR